MRMMLRRKFTDMLAGSMRAANTQALRVTKEIATSTLEYAVRTSPQYTGQFASNWRLSINTPKPGRDRPALSQGQQALSDPYGEGDDPAITRALTGRGNKLSQLKLGDRIFLSTSAFNDEGENYAFDIELGTMKFRKVNPSGGRVLARAVQHVKVTFAGVAK